MPRVDIINVYPGANGDLLKDAVERHGAKGIVVIGYGAGNVNKDFFQSIKEVKKKNKNIPIVIESRCGEGNVEPVYASAGGGVSLSEIGVIFGGIISPSKVRIMLMLSIANGYDLRSNKNDLHTRYLPNIIDAAVKTSQNTTH